MFVRIFYIFIPSWIQVNIRDEYKHLLSKFRQNRHKESHRVWTSKSVLYCTNLT